MNALKTLAAGLVIAAAIGMAPPTRAATSSELLQQGLYAEEVEGNIESAIRIYGEVARNGSAPPVQVAQALYRQGMCYLKIKDETAARTALNRLVTEFPDQTELVGKARQVLEELMNFDPAAIMPAETLMYLELGSPGRQIETIVNMLKGTPYENPLAMMNPGAPQNPNEKSPAAIIGALLNPSMMAEFKKIRSSAIGITGLSQNGPPPMIAVLYPGKSDALRGILLAALGVAGTASDPILGMQTLRVQDIASVAYDDHVFIAASPPRQLEWCVKQYKGALSEPTLASRNTSFSTISKRQRQEQALTVWANLDEMYARVLTQFPEGHIPQQLVAANTIVDFPNLDFATLTFAVEPDGLAGKANFQFKENHRSLAHNLLRTPNINKAAFAAIPPQAIAVASVALGEPNSTQAQELRARVQNITGLDLGRELFANLEQVSLYLMPPEPGVPAGPPHSRLGVAFTSRDPAKTRELFLTLLGTAATLSGGSADPANGIYRIGAAPSGSTSFQKDQVNGTTLLAFDPAILETSRTALRMAASAMQTGPLHKALARLPASVSKVVLVNVGGAIRVAASDLGGLKLDDAQAQALQNHVDQLARAAESATLEIRTEEQIDSLCAGVTVSDLPPLNKVLGSLSEITRITSAAKAAMAARDLRRQVPAVIAPAAAAPQIDGAPDPVWESARIYPIANRMFDDPESDADLSGEFRALWDDTHLYVLVNVSDDTLRNDSEKDQWFQDDSVEIYIDASNAKRAQYGETEYQYAFNWGKTAPQLQELKHNRTDGVQFATVNTPGGYRLEVALPWSAIGARPVAGASIGFDVHVNDDDSGQRNSKLMWHDVADQAWQNPQHFGNASLGGLVGWWKFDETGGATASDSSGANRDGAVTDGATWKPGRLANALDLHGGFVRIPHDPAFDMADELSVACWVNLRSVPADWTALVTKGDDAWRLSMNERTRGLHFSIDGDYSEAARVNSAKELGLNEWHHVAAVYASDAMRLYIDGALDSEVPRTGNVGRNELEVMIGENAQQTGRRFDGLLDDVRVYNHALAEKAVQALAGTGSR